jgi:hypothetical protein
MPGGWPGCDTTSADGEARVALRNAGAGRLAALPETIGIGIFVVGVLEAL